MQAERLSNYSKSTVKACTPASVSAAHSYWVDKCLEVSGVWKEQGALYGTLSVLRQAMGDIYAVTANTGELSGQLRRMIILNVY